MNNFVPKSTNTPMRCLVLGGRGFIGSHLIDALLDKGYLVRCFDRPHIAPLGKPHLTNQNFELYEGDFVSDTDLANALEDCDICYHLVSTTLPQSSNADPVFDVASNVISTIRLLSHAVKSGLKKMIFVSSGGTVYGVPQQIPITEDHPTNPVCSYGITKLTIEKYLNLFQKLHGLDYTVLRIANPFGEGQRLYATQGAIAVFCGKVLKDEPISIWGDGSVVRDYIPIADVVNALLLSLEKSTEEHVFNIGSGYGYSLNEVLKAIEKISGHTIKRHYLPARAFDVPTNVLSIVRAKKYLGWSPVVGFEQGLKRYLSWLGMVES